MKIELTFESREGEHKWSIAPDNPPATLEQEKQCMEALMEFQAKIRKIVSPPKEDDSKP
jgi:hypothetical protein